MMPGMVVFDSVVAVLAVIVGFLLHKWFVDKRIGEATAVARRIVESAERGERREWGLHGDQFTGRGTGDAT